MSSLISSAKHCTNIIPLDHYTLVVKQELAILEGDFYFLWGNLTEKVTYDRLPMTGYHLNI